MIERRTFTAMLGASAVAMLAPPARSAEAAKEAAAAAKPAGPNRIFQPAEVTTTGSVTIGGKPVAYQAVAGTLVVHGPGWNDVAWREQAAAPSPDKDKDGLPPECSMFYTAYFKQGGGAARPLMFL